jgi:hypothetical protein
MSQRIERGVLIVHGMVTLAAAVVLAVFPAAIPRTVGISISPDEYLLSYFLAAAELSIGLLSLAAVRLRDSGAVRLIALCFVALHGATAVLEVVYSLNEGANGVLTANISVRVIVMAAFVLVVRRRPA